MDKYWLKSYPEGVPAVVDPSLYPSLPALFAEAFGKYADRPAYICMGKSISYREIDDMSRKLGAWLQAQGLARGDRVAIMLPNLLQYPVALAAVLRAGFVAVNVNPLYTPRELLHQLRDSEAKAIVALENFAVTVELALASFDIAHVVLASVGDLLSFPKGMIVNYLVRHKSVPPYSLPQAVRFKDAVAQGASKPLNEPALQREDPAILQYTGGTTGVSKGATLSHRALIASALSSQAWLQPALRAKAVSGQMTYVCALPLYHVYALVNVAMLAMRTGGLCLLIPDPRDISAFVAELGKHKFNMFPAVNTLFNALLHDPDFAALDFSSLVVSNGGGMAMQEAVARKWQEVTGLPIVEGYGLSETSSAISCNPSNSKEFSGNVGLPLPSVEICILDDNGVEVPLGQPGEVAIRGPHLMSNYWNRPDETAKVMTADGFFKSGDIGTMDERGYLKIVDRKKDMIIVSGFNVYPNEIEAVVAEHPGILECAVVGTPDPHTGEAVMLYVVPKDPRLTKEDLAAFYKDKLTGYKKPHHVEFVEALPKSNVGKILRRELRDQRTAQA